MAMFTIKKLMGFLMARDLNTIMAMELFPANEKTKIPQKTSVSETFFAIGLKQSTCRCVPFIDVFKFLDIL